MKVTKEQISKIKELKQQGKKIVEISRELNIPYKIVCYYSNEKSREKYIERAKKYQKESKLNRDKKNYREYQREYHKKRYETNLQYREYIKKKNRENRELKRHQNKEL